MVVLIAIVILFSLFISGALTPSKKLPQQSTPAVITPQCCDSGSGDSCQASTERDKIFTFNGTQYGLLKSNITLSEAIYHLRDSDERFDGKPIIVNTTNDFGAPYGECGRGRDDQVWHGGRCAAIPNDVIVYVCKERCDLPPLGTPYCGSLNIFCYGQNDSVYDVYFRLSDTIPDVIKNCEQVSLRPFVEVGGQQIIVEPTRAPDEPRKNLQLKSFSLLRPAQNAIPWLSPYCKPAIYLYPKEKTDINVKVVPQGKLTLTIPNYPNSGWDVTAYPSGKITDQQTSYDYLYYEAQIPDDLIEKPKGGFVLPYTDLATLFSTLLPTLGLNEKESSQFSEYWLKALPKSPYYFVGVVSPENLNKIAPLTINPRPDNMIRVTLYFELLDQSLTVNSPTIHTPKRDGFTAVEWGGIVKTDPTHPFSCLM